MTSKSGQWQRSGYSSTSTNFCTSSILNFNLTKNIQKEYKYRLLAFMRKNHGVKNVCCYPINQASKNIMPPYVQVTSKLLHLFRSRTHILLFNTLRRNIFILVSSCAILMPWAFVNLFSQLHRHRIIPAHQNMKNQNMK